MFVFKFHITSRIFTDVIGVVLLIFVCARQVIIETCRLKKPRVYGEREKFIKTSDFTFTSYCLVNERVKRKNSKPKQRKIINPESRFGEEKNKRTTFSFHRDDIVFTVQIYYDFVHICT